MIALKPRQIRAARKAIGRAGTWLAAWLVVFAGSAFALRDPVTLEVAVWQAIDLIDASHDHHHDHARSQSPKTDALKGANSDHLGHDHRDCPLCSAPALAGGAPSLIAARFSSAGIKSRLSKHTELHHSSEHRGSVQSRAPPPGMAHA